MVTVRTAKARYRIGVFKPSIPPPRRLDRVVVQIQRYWDRWSHTSSVLVCPHPFTQPSHTCLQKWGTGASNRAHRLRSGTEVDPLVRHRRSLQRLSTDVGSEHTFSRRSGTEEDLERELGTGVQKRGLLGQGFHDHEQGHGCERQSLSYNRGKGTEVELSGTRLSSATEVNVSIGTEVDVLIGRGPYYL
ncbi:hypothetical protein SUGI_1373400 [Cryptomeria japonica]|uniref:Uncharacterized protein n=1 Tax=Cryptomeria japonica TaxID=3369 RepID=A0AAD3NTS5_CRYJA|nr:hypothetical protein SUGI_1373400 [Cryptomeria japonica]